MPKLHKVRVRGVNGVTEYWYAWRCGPRILKAQGR